MTVASPKGEKSSDSPVKESDVKYDTEPMDKNDPDQDISSGPVKKRKCTDVLCLIFFLVHVVVFVALAGWAFGTGNPYRLTAMRDHAGAYCGYNKNWNPWNTDDRRLDRKGYKKMLPAQNSDSIVGGLAKSVACSTEGQAYWEAKHGVAPTVMPTFTEMCGANPAAPIDVSATMAEYSDPSKAADKITGGGGGESMLENMGKYFHQTCVSDCAEVSAWATAPPADLMTLYPSTREYKYKPPEDSSWYLLADAIWSEIDANTLSAATYPKIAAAFSNLKFKALPPSMCGNSDLRYCVPYAGTAYNDIAHACIMKLTPAAGNALSTGATEAFNAKAQDASSENLERSFGTAVGDIQKAWACLLIVVVIAIVVGFIYMIILRFCVGVLVWSTVGAIFGLLMALGLYFIVESRACVKGDENALPNASRMLMMDSHHRMLKPAGEATCELGYKIASQDQRQVYFWFGVIICCIAALYGLFILCLCRQIRLAIAINKVAAIFVAQTKTPLMVPLVTALTMVAYFTIWCVVALFLVSQVSDNLLPEGPFTQTEAVGTDSTAGECATGVHEGSAYFAPFKDGVLMPECSGFLNGVPQVAKCWRCVLPRFVFTVQFAYAFFSMLWTSAWFVAILITTLAGAVGIWYFTVKAQKGKVSVCRPSFKICWRYHLGSLAFGSFVLAVVQMIKWTMYYIQKCSEAQKNYVMAKIACVLKYCVACFERFIKFLNKNAYIQIALLGKGFCKSAWNAFCLILRNAARIGVLGMLGGVIRWIGIIFIVVCTGVLGYFILEAGWNQEDTDPDMKISTPWVLVFLFCFLGYVIGQLFMNVYSLAVDTILQCFVIDEELNGGFGEHTPENLKPFLRDPKKKGGGCCGNKV